MRYTSKVITFSDTEEINYIHLKAIEDRLKPIRARNTTIMERNGEKEACI